MSKKTYTEVLEETIKNIEHDRAKADKLLNDLITHIDNQQTKWTHRDVGEIAAKYLETLQRSNEQLVKIAGLMQKKASSVEEEASLSLEEKTKLFDDISPAEDK